MNVNRDIVDLIEKAKRMKIVMVISIRTSSPVWPDAGLKKLPNCFQKLRKLYPQHFLHSFSDFKIAQKSKNALESEFVAKNSKKRPIWSHWSSPQKLNISSAAQHSFTIFLFTSLVQLRLEVVCNVSIYKVGEATLARATQSRDACSWPELTRDCISLQCPYLVILSFMNCLYNLGNSTAYHLGQHNFVPTQRTLSYVEDWNMSFLGVMKLLNPKLFKLEVSHTSL